MHGYGESCTVIMWNRIREAGPPKRWRSLWAIRVCQRSSQTWRQVPPPAPRSAPAGHLPGTHIACNCSLGWMAMVSGHDSGDGSAHGGGRRAGAINVNVGVMRFVGKDSQREWG